MSQNVTNSVMSKSDLFTEAKWTQISSDVADAFRMDESERAWFAEKRIAKLIAAIPFLAECEDAERTAVAHLGTYLLSIRETKKYFNAKPEDSESISERLRLGMSFKGGNPEIIDRAMSLIALVMIWDYRRDAEEDVFLRKYNPVSMGDFDFEMNVTALEEKIKRIPCPEMDRILPLAVTPDVYWQGGQAD